MLTTRFAHRLSWMVLIPLGIATTALACQVPVFRYALERWPADTYQLLILHREPLSEEDRNRQERLRKLALQDKANLEARAIQLGKEADPALTQLWEKHSQSGGPLMALLYPQTAGEVPDRVAAVLPFSDASAANLTSSPIRDEITKRLADGESAVWIFVPSGHADQDAIAAKALQEQIKADELRLTLPSLEEMELEPAQMEKVKVALRVGFSMLTLDRDDSEERWLLQLLLGSEPDLEALDEPMAFPVFGRGRVLYALVGAGITGENIRSASSFIVGPCSCQVKNQNPGFDLLLKYDWETAVGETRLSDPLPEEPSQPSLRTIPPGRASR